MPKFTPGENAFFVLELFETLREGAVSRNNPVLASTEAVINPGTISRALELQDKYKLADNQIGGLAVLAQALKEKQLERQKQMPQIGEFYD